MPERDTVHKGLHWRLQKAYKQLCERQNPSSIARTLERETKRFVQKYGDAPVEVFLELEKIIAKHCPGHLFYNSNAEREAFNDIEKLAEAVIPNKRVRKIATRSCKQVLDLLVSGKVHPRDVVNRACTLYVEHVFNDAFLYRLHSTPKHVYNIAREDIDAHMEQVLPMVQESFQYFGSQMQRQGTVDKLKGLQRNGQIGTFDNLNKL